ncbi:hypothetical protein HPB47_000413 [Ixodes persulcatus]|uniref:Uncharacterized protein n=1 Tax=Ixodes persulcatus TaxID=34615 RepID=A0AC60PRT2_IXOPE|nr:hypothetical protein HPB47_000413 [Ixodes persulcatus]
MNNGGNNPNLWRFPLPSYSTTHILSGGPDHSQTQRTRIHTKAGEPNSSTAVRGPKFASNRAEDSTTEGGSDVQDAPFTMQDLALVLDSISVPSVPDKGGITWRRFHNLDEPEKRQLLTGLNAVLTTKLEEAGTGPYCGDPQTGFCPVFRTHDNLHLLRNMVGEKRRGTNIVPGLLVAVDLQKAFNTVKHSAKIEAHEECGAGTRIVNAVKGFFKNRAFEISSGAKQPRTFPNVCGVHQGASTSSTLLNLIMRRISKKLCTIKRL